MNLKIEAAKQAYIEQRIYRAYIAIIYQLETTFNLLVAAWSTKPRIIEIA